MLMRSENDLKLRIHVFTGVFFKYSANNYLHTDFLEL